MEFGEAKDNGIVDVGGVNVNEEKMKDYLWYSYLNGKNLSVTGKVMQLELKLNTILEWASDLDLTTEQRLQLNEFKL
jgi:hypothetical protein